METINMQCKSMRYLLYAESCLSGRAYIGVEIHAEMSELLDKQVYVLNECFK